MVEEEEALIRSAYLADEFKRIEVLLTNLKSAKSVTHTISIPQGDIFVTINKPFWARCFRTNTGGPLMSNEGQENVKNGLADKSLVKQTGRTSLLNVVDNGLTVSEMDSLKPRIIEEQLQLDVSQQKAEQRFVNSTRDMAATVRAVNALEDSSKSDYEVKSTFETASGRTDIHVKKNNNTVIIVVAIVIGLIIFILVK